MTMGQIGATSKRGANRQAFSPEAGRAQQLPEAWAWEVIFAISIDAVGNLYTRRVGSVPIAAPELTGHI
jgi:beta-ureidopropionase / N-carbamoyl-L-amino-acid hydrolase